MLSSYLEHYSCLRTRFRMACCYWSCLSFLLLFVSIFRISLLESNLFLVRTIRKLSIRQAQFKELLSANRNMSSGGYFRLMGLAGVEVLFTIPMGAFSIYLNASGTPIHHWVSWADTHYDFSRVDQIPSVVWHQNQLTVASIELTRYAVVFCAFLFIAFFGFADEARRNYRLAYTSFASQYLSLPACTLCLVSLILTSRRKNWKQIFPSTCQYWLLQTDLGNYIC